MEWMWGVQEPSEEHTISRPSGLQWGLQCQSWSPIWCCRKSRSRLSPLSLHFQGSGKVCWWHLHCTTSWLCSTLLYIQGLSERLLQNVNIRTRFCPNQTVQQILVKPKDPVPVSSLNGVIYEIVCSDCPKTYVGHSKRSLGCRLKEHKRAVNNGEIDMSAVAELLGEWTLVPQDLWTSWVSVSLLECHYSFVLIMFSLCGITYQSSLSNYLSYN